MKSYLEEKIGLIYQNHGPVFDEISIIIPNKRASVYIRKYLAAQVGKPFFAPEIITISDWIAQHTPQRIVPQNELLFQVYDIYKSIQKKDPEDFNEFMKWGRILLSDFDEIDRYLVPPKLIFRDLRNIKEIEHWSFDNEPLSEGQKKLLGLWDQLPDYYTQLAKLLDDRHEIYQGKAYQRFADGVEEIAKHKKHFYFLGFNALSASEEKIISSLIKLKKATFYSDIDSFYFNNPQHEAAYFYRQLCAKWAIKPDVGDYFNASPKKIEIIETAQQIGQCKIAGNVLQRFFEEGQNLSSTAVVLADESLLIPLTRSLPGELETVNITMGYPIKYSHLKSLVDLVFDLQFNFQKFASSRLYHKTLLKILDHAFISVFIKDAKALTKLEGLILDKNKVFLEWAELEQELPELAQLTGLFSLWENPARDGFAAIHQLTDALVGVLKTNKRSADIELEILHHFAAAIEGFEMIWNAYPHELNLKSFKRLFYQFWQGEALSFLGNPVEGVQVMGILETRTIDFDNLIILGMNEGNLPQANISNSFIPFDLRLVHHLPTEEDRQAIFAHHFYRLMHRAKNVVMTYNSGSEELGNAEKSRFITQLENELDFSKGHTLTESAFTPGDTSARVATVQYLSNEAVHRKLDSFFERGLSPSALNKLINCPMDFYYRYILDMKENDQVEENIESSTFGTKIHDVLEQVFRTNFLDKKIALDAKILLAEKSNLETYLRDKYLEEFSPTDMKYGQNKLSFEISLQFLHKFIDKQVAEIKAAQEPIYITELEKKDFEVVYDWEINGVKKKIKLAGKADRMDEIGSTSRIIDYKSGKCDDSKILILTSHMAPGGMVDLMRHRDKGYARQLLMYALMFRATYPQKKQFTAGIISMINLNDWLQNVRVGPNGDPLITDSLLDSFEAELKSQVEALYRNDFLFAHDERSHYCEHCGN